MGIISFVLVALMAIIACDGESCRKGICVIDDDRTIYYIPGKAHLSLPCMGKPSNVQHSESLNRTVDVSWVLEGPQGYDSLLLAKWIDHIEGQNGTMRQTRSVVQTTLQLDQQSQREVTEQLSWGLSFSVSSLSQNLLFRLRVGTAKCKISDFGKARVFIREAKPPSFVDIRPIREPESNNLLQPRLNSGAQSNGTNPVVDSVVGRKLQFQCMSDGIPPPVVNWWLNGEPWDHVQTTNFTPGSSIIASTVSFETKRSHNAAILSCSSRLKTVDGESDAIMSKQLRLRIAAPPNQVAIRQRGGFWNEEKTIGDKRGETTSWKAAERSTMRMDCTSDCIGSCRYSWRFKERLIDTGEAVIGDDGNKITESQLLLSAGREKTGFYSCAVHGKAGDGHSSWRKIVVYWAPSVPEISWIKNASKTGLRCHVHDPGMPEATPFWTTTTGNLSVNMTGSDLFPEPPVHSSESLSKYQCIAKNIVGSQSTSIYFAFARRETVITRNPKQSIVPSNADRSRNDGGHKSLFNESGNNEEGSTAGTEKGALSRRPDDLDSLDKNADSVSFRENPASAKVQRKHSKTVIDAEAAEAQSSKERRKTNSSLISAAIIIVGLAVCTILITSAMRCSLQSGSATVVHIDNESFESIGNKTCSSRTSQSGISRTPTSQSSQISQSSTTDQSINREAAADVPFDDEESQIIPDDDEGFVIEYRGVHGESEQDYSSAAGSRHANTEDRAVYQPDVRHAQSGIGHERMNEQEDSRPVVHQNIDLQTDDGGIAENDVPLAMSGRKEELEPGSRGDQDGVDEEKAGNKATEEIAEPQELKLTHSAELFGHYVNDLNTFFTMFDDLTKKLHEEADAIRKEGNDDTSE